MEILKHIAGYPHFEKEFVGAHGTFNDCHGKQVGTAKIIARWRTPRSWVASHQNQIEVAIKGRIYTGRGAGSNMLYFGKLKSVKAK